MHYKGYKIRLYPNKKQEELLVKHIGCHRFIWNYMLALQNERHANKEPRLSNFDMVNHFLSMKKQPEYSWLNEVSCSVLQNSCLSLDKAYRNCFEKGQGFPKFKSKKKSKQTYKACAPELYFYENKTVHIQKVGNVKYKSDFNFPTKRKSAKFLNTWISKDDEKWFLSFEMECEDQAFNLNDYSLGIDLGVKELAVVAYENKQKVFPNINKSKKVREIKKKICFYHASIGRKYETNKLPNGKYVKTNNIARQEEKVERLYKKLSGIRNNYTHQITHELVSLLPKRVIMEKLYVDRMFKNIHLREAIAEQCFYEFSRQMRYKCEWKGIEFIYADPYFPSSKTCSCCGSIKQDLKLSDRKYVCKKCGLIIDRDYNAALNLMRYEA